MREKIPEILASRKARDMALIGVLVLTGITAFGLGRLSVTAPASASVALYHPAPKPTETLVGSTEIEGQSATGSGTGEYVASKNGTAYHLPWCSGAQRIKDENKVWFATKEEAEAAGYRPAGNCKGI